MEKKTISNFSDLVDSEQIKDLNEADPDLIPSLWEDFKVEILRLKSQLEVNIQKENYEQITFDAHSAKGLCRNLGLPKCAEHFQNLELAARETRNSDIKTLFTELPQVLEDSTQAFERYFNSSVLMS